MKPLLKQFICYVVIILCSGLAIAETNHWEIIRNYLSIDTPAAYKELGSYVESLNADELIEAGRQCSMKADATCPESIFCEETLYLLGFFYNKYPKKNGLADIDRIFNEIENKQQTNFWRASLIDFLGNNDWLSLLNSEQQYSAVDRMFRIIPDANEHPVLRYYAIKTTDDILECIEKNNLSADINIQKKLQEGYGLDKLKEELYQEKITLSDNCKNAENRIMKVYNEYVNELLVIIDEQNRNPMLLRGVLRSIEDSLNRPLESVPQIQGALENSIRNYQKFDKGNWNHLARIGYESLHLPDSLQITEKMLQDMHRKLEAEKDKKQRNNLQNEIDSLKQLIKNQKKEIISQPPA